MVRIVAPEPMARRLQAQARLGMRHRVTWEAEVSTRNQNGEYETSWQTDGDEEEPCLLMMGSQNAAELAAAIGVKASGTCRVILGRVVAAGMRGLVRWTTRGVDYQRLVRVKSGTDETNRLAGIALVEDEDLSG